MSFQAMSWAMAQQIKPVHKLALLYLADGYHPHDAPNDLAVDKVAAFCGILVSDADRIIAELLDAGLIVIRGESFWLALPEEPQAVRPKEDPDAYLYVMECDGLIKIGITRRLESRVASIQTNNPHPVTLLHHREGPLSAVRAWERACHDELSESHRIGEWFAVDAQDAIAIVDSMEAPSV